MSTATDVSVCIPYWINSGRAASDLMATLGGFVKLYPTAELSLCDDGSMYGMRDFGALRQVRLPTKKRALNPCTAINEAVRNSTRPLILLTNPGLLPEEGLLEALLAAHQSDRHYVAAACWDLDGQKWLCHSTVKGGEHGRGPMPAGSGFHFCALLSRSLFDAAGGFDEEYRHGQGYDDNDFLWRLDAAGAVFRILDDVIVEHRRSETIWPEGGLDKNRALFEAKWINPQRLPAVGK